MALSPVRSVLEKQKKIRLLNSRFRISPEKNETPCNKDEMQFVN